MFEEALQTALRIVGFTDELVELVVRKRPDAGASTPGPDAGASTPGQWVGASSSSSGWRQPAQSYGGWPPAQSWQPAQSQRKRGRWKQDP